MMPEEAVRVVEALDEGFELSKKMRRYFAKRLLDYHFEISLRIARQMPDDYDRAPPWSRMRRALEEAGAFRGKPKPRVDYPPGLPIDAETYTLNGRSYVRATQRFRAVYRGIERDAREHWRSVPKRPSAIAEGAKTARLWTVACLRKNPDRHCDWCGVAPGDVRGFRAFIRHCSERRFGQPIPGPGARAIFCNDCEPEALAELAGVRAAPRGGPSMVVEDVPDGPPPPWDDEPGGELDEPIDW